MKSHLTVLTVVLLHDAEGLLMLPLLDKYTHCNMYYVGTSLHNTFGKTCTHITHRVECSQSQHDMTLHDCKAC